MTHTAGRRDGRQEGRESGYYNLHRNLNKTLLHNLTFIYYLLTWKRLGPQPSDISPQPSYIS